MPLLAALLLIGTAQAAPAPSPLFTAFEAACGKVQTYDSIAAAAVAAGWIAITEQQADPRIAAIVGRAREAAQKERAMVSGQLFRQRVDGRDVYLATSTALPTPDFALTGCRVYDLDMPAAPARETIDAWVGTPPTTVQASGNAVKRVWAAWKPRVRLEITYVPRDNPLGLSYGIQGLVLVAQSTGGI